MTVAFKGHTDLPIFFPLTLHQVVQALLGGLLQWASSDFATSWPEVGTSLYILVPS